MENTTTISSLIALNNLSSGFAQPQHTQGPCAVCGSAYKAVLLLQCPIFGLDRVFDNPWIYRVGNICISTVDGKSELGRELWL